MDPNPFDPWDHEPGELRHEFRRICRHGRVQLHCPFLNCQREAMNKALLSKEAWGGAVAHKQSFTHAINTASKNFSKGMPK